MERLRQIIAEIRQEAEILASTANELERILRSAGGERVGKSQNRDGAKRSAAGSVRKHKHKQSGGG
jgi:hypothetical protein